MSPRPAYDELPLVPELQLRHAWDVYGSDDQLGTINLLSEDRVAQAVGLARHGIVASLALALGEIAPPLWDRTPVQHTIFRADRNSVDERVDSLYTHGTTHWDSLRHINCREFGFYGGVTDEFTPGSGPLGIEHWAEHGIVGRGVLLDLEAFLSQRDEHYDPLAAITITVDDLVGCARQQETELCAGDVLCLRFGWVASYRALDQAARDAYAPDPVFAGLYAGEEMARFLWDAEVAAVACDNPAVEVRPGDPRVGSLHRRLLPLLGFALGELFDFERAHQLCAAENRYEFLFVSAPLRLRGGVGSPANALAIL